MIDPKKLREAVGSLRHVANVVEEVAEHIEDTGGDAMRAMQRSCQSKRSYETPEAAGQAAADRGEPGLRVYGCQFCGGFHLTKRTLEEFDNNRKNERSRQ